jgi:hypothetical protein
MAGKERQQPATISNDRQQPAAATAIEKGRPKKKTARQIWRAAQYCVT